MMTDAPTVHALVAADGGVIRTADFTADNPPPVLSPEKGLRWLPVIDIRPVPAVGEMLGEPIITVSADAVTQTWPVLPAPPPEAPMVAGKAQVVVILMRLGLLADVEADIVALGAEAAAAWAAASEIRRNGVILTEVAKRRGWGEVFIADFFRAAAALRL